MKKNLRYFMTLLLMMVASVGWAQEDPNWSYTAVKGDKSVLDTENKTFTVDESHVWNYEVTLAAGVSPTITMGTSYEKYAIKFGESGSKYYNPVILSTTAFKDKAVTKVKLHVRHNGSKTGKLTVTQGGVEIGTATTEQTSSWIDVVCSETNKGSGGTLSIKYEVAQALYINTIEVWYENNVSAVATPTFTPAAGTYTSAQNVTISTTTEDATIYYTLDGNDPTNGSSEYTGPINISATTTVKAIAIKGEESSGIATATYTIIQGGTETDPFTVAEAREVIDALSTVEGVYVTGIVSEIVTQFNSEYGNISYNISEDGTTTGNQLLAYRGKGFNGAAFTSADDVKVGDVVVIYGNLKKNNSTYEFDEGNYLVSQVHSTKVDPALSYNPTSFEIVEGSEFTAPTLSTVDGFSGNISYTSSNPNVATVAADGSVAIVGVGTTTITAAFAGNNNYLPGKASYTLKVKKTGVLFYESVSGYTGTSDLSTALTIPNDYLDSEDWDSFTKVYAGKNGHFKFGTSSESGTAVTKAIPLTGTGVLTYKVQRYDSSNAGNLTITVTGATAQGDTEVTGTADWVEKTVYLTEATGEVVITFASSSKRIRVDDIMVAETVLPDFYLAGSFNEWSTTSAKMTMQDDGTYTITQEMATAAEFKIVKTVGETTTWYGAAAEGETYWVNEENATNIALIDGKNFYMTAGGTYTLTLDPAAMTLTVTGWPETEYNLLGSFNGWTASDDNKLTKGENGIYTITATVEAGATFKIKDSKGTWYGAEADGDFWIKINNHTNIATKTDNGSNFYLENAGTYTFTFNTSTKTLTVDGMALFEVPVGCGIYQKVTSAGELEAGKRYLIVNEKAGKAFGGFSTTSTVYGIAEDATIDAYNDSQFIDASSSTTIHPVAFFASGENWLIADGNKFLAWTSGNSLISSETVSDNSTWKIAYTEGTSTITNVADENRILQYNSANPRFACYNTTSQQPVAIYKELAEAPTVSTITISPAKEYTTLTSSYALDFTNTGLSAYIVKEEDVTATSVKLTQVSKVPANTGLVIQKTGTEDSYSVPVLTGEPEDVRDNKMVGSATTTTAIAENAGYILKDGKFSPSAEGTLAAGKAYLAVSVLAGAKDLNIVFGEGTGINNVNVNENESGKIFNLAGQQMKSAVKGVYIKNGKKYIK